MRMLHLRFNNAGVFPSTKKTPKNWAFSEKDGKYCHQEIGAENFANPITTNIVANVLRAMCGDIPVPTLKPNDIGKNSIFDEMAKDAYVKYDAPRMDNKGKPMFIETLNLNKSHVPNSNSKATQVFHLFDGSTYIAKGAYNWHYFDETFSNDNPINKESLISFINEILKIDNARKYPFKEIVYQLSRYWHTEEFDNRVKVFFSEKYTTNAINGPWAYILFGCTYNNGALSYDIPTGSNSSFKSKTPLLYTRGIGNVMYINGDIWCPINEKIERFISINGGSATILDGGLAYIIGIENVDGGWLKCNGYERILERIKAITLAKSDI